MLQFVILRHDAPQGVHFDFMLEFGGVLKTWALSQPPEPDVEMECDVLADHRLAYLDYEGPLSGGRGSVTRWDRGAYRVDRQSDEEWIVELEGQKVAGKATLCRAAGDPSRWSFSFTQKLRG